MNFHIHKAAVLGSGVMGSGIAAHLANAGIPVLLLDMTVPGKSRNELAQAAVTRLRKQKPAPLMTERALSLIEVGNFDDDITRVSECDWVVEAITEDIKLKRALFARLEPLLGKTTIVSSNTSGMRISGMTEGRSDEFKSRFLVTHFFNPVRYMKLLELVPGEKTSPGVLLAVAAFCERVLGKGIVFARDTPNFIANRIGTYSMLRSIQLMERQQLSIEEVDKMCGPAIGRPKSAVFRTADLVGLDTFLLVTKNCYDALLEDPSRETFKAPPWLEQMLERQMLGEKSGGGFYKKEVSATGKEILVLDYTTLSYRTQKKVRFESLGAAYGIEDVGLRLKTVMCGTDKAAQFVERVVLDTLAYAASLVGKISNDYVNIDRAIRWGFAWRLGPFEMWDAYGVQAALRRMEALHIPVAPWVEDMLASGRGKFYEPEGAFDTYWSLPSQSSLFVPTINRQLSVASLRRRHAQVDANDSATLWNLGDGILGMEFHSKMNAIDTMTVEFIHKAVEVAEKSYRALIVGNDGSNFSVGANIAMLLWAVKDAQWVEVEKLVSSFQGANQRLRYSAVPVVTAPFGLTLGGGCEVTMAGNVQQASAETYIGLVECAVGLIPAGSGTLQLLRNLFGMHAGNPDFDAFPFIKKAFLNIGMAKVTMSAEEAKEAGFLTQDAGVSMNRDYLLADAKARAIGMAEAGFIPPRPVTLLLPGKSGAATIDMLLYDMMQKGQISEYDRVIGKKLATVLTGGDVSATVPLGEQHLLNLEKEAFLSLCGEEKTQNRMQYMLEKGKPLRN